MSEIIKKISLNGKWSVCSIPNEIMQNRLGTEFEQLEFNGNVPGSTLNDLINSGTVTNDIFWRDNAEKIQKYENYNWKYTKQFTIDALPAHGAELVFERLDTYCDIHINGEHLAFCDNGYIEHRFDITGKLILGENTLEVDFYSPINYTLDKPTLSAAFTKERLYNRRIQCTYGWDWTMRFVTTGIYGDCYIALPDGKIRIKDSYIYTKNIDNDSASVGFDFDLSDDSADGILKFDIISPLGETVRSYNRYCREKFFRFTLDIPDPELWYPSGYGDQPIYTLSVKHEDKEIYTENFGIRIIKVLRLPDKEGSKNYARALELKETDFSKHYDKNEEFSGCILKVNGIKIMCKGANWVPCSPFETEGMEEKITKILTLSKSAGMNIVRVWGGGYIEKKHFYNECSRLGLLVLQDFFMACGAYPEKEEWFIRHLSREAEYTVKYLRNQPCLAWWHGDNENAVGGCDTDTDHRGRDSAYSGLAPSVWKYDPYREFFPSSPYGGKTNASNTAGTTHNTQFLSFTFDYMDRDDLSDYKEYFGEQNARFISEEPTFGASSLTALRKMMTDEDIFGDDITMWKYHTQSNPDLKKHLFDYYISLTEKVLGKFEDGRDRLFKYQYIQCELARLSIERVRREKWFSAGVVFWMLSDCWAASSGWSFIDFYCAPKPSFYAFKRAAAPIIPSINKQKDGTLHFTVANDTLSSERIAYRFTPIKNRQIACNAEWVPAVVSANSSTPLPCPQQISDGEILVIDVMRENDITRSFYKNGDLEIKRAPENAYTIETTDRSVKITANTYLQAIGLESDDIETVWSDNYFTMLPGETKEIFAENGALPNFETIAYTL